jgi:hypothetical protein
LRIITTFAAFALSTSAMAQTNTEVVCSYAPSQSKAVATISGAAGGSAATATAVASAAGLTVVAHSSGTAILTGSSGYIAGTLGGAAAAPVIVTVGLVVGGAAVTLELVCAGKNHPDQVKKVFDAATEFGNRFKGVMQNTTVSVGKAAKSIQPAAGRAAVEVKRVSSDAWRRYVYRASE